MRLLALFFLFSFSFCDDLLSPYQYGKMLYNDPRGIACSSCHGKKGEGSIISAVKIQKDGKKKLIKIEAPRINNLNEKEFIKRFKKFKKIEPVYYLTDKELAYIYIFLEKEGRDHEKSKKH